MLLFVEYGCWLVVGFCVVVVVCHCCGLVLVSLFVAVMVGRCWCFGIVGVVVGCLWLLIVGGVVVCWCCSLLFVVWYHVL